MTDCKSDALCDGGKCVKAFSLKPGEKVKNIENAILLCQYGTVLLSTLECIKTTYADKEKSGFVECNPGDKCLYKKDGSDELIDTKICECGYNKDGKSYCPLATTAGNNY